MVIDTCNCERARYKYIHHSYIQYHLVFHLAVDIVPRHLQDTGLEPAHLADRIGYLRHPPPFALAVLAVDAHQIPRENAGLVAAGACEKRDITHGDRMYICMYVCMKTIIHRCKVLGYMDLLYYILVVYINVCTAWMDGWMQ